MTILTILDLGDNNLFSQPFASANDAELALAEFARECWDELGKVTEPPEYQDELIHRFYGEENSGRLYTIQDFGDDWERP